MSTHLNAGTPATPGVYVVNGYDDTSMRRHRHPATGFSAPYYFDDPADIIERAHRTPIDRDALPSLRWRAA